MTRSLDSRLHEIIGDAAGKSGPKDAVYPFNFPENIARPAFIRPLEEQSRQDVFKFLPIGVHQGALMIGEFEPDIFQSNSISEQLKTNDNCESLSLYTRNMYSSAKATLVHNHPFIRHNPQRQPVNQPIYPGKLSFTSENKRYQGSQSRYSEPTDISYDIDESQPLQRQQDKSRTPLNSTGYIYTPPFRTTETPPLLDGLSSPSDRIILRRRIDRPRAITASEKLETFIDDKETLHNLSRQDNMKLMFGPGGITSSTSDAHPVIHGIRLMSPYELPDNFRHVFPYELFNAVQSKCFASVYKTNDNVVISAPTGSGKTAILELAICKLVQDYSSGQFKIVYQAPTKSLCAERVRDWQKKFSHLNLPCAELTGDTDVSEMQKVGRATILVTTPEKWDSITRKWKDYIKLLQMVKLFLIDEIHILKDVRGATLEAVVSRMKSIGANVRFVAISATVPNSQDIAAWLGKDHTRGHLPAQRETFGEEFRPVRLQKHVYGYSGSPNDFAFENVLDIKLPGLIAKHTKGKPMMIFCFTRKSCEETAAKLAEWWTSLPVNSQAWPAPTYRVLVGSSELRDLVGRGVAFHHAGLDAQDRTAIESAFGEGCISVICCTSTLAVGVNLPCHLVVIKNTACYTQDGLGEYSDLELMQMLGRAGRPQFDDSATAIIMTRSEKVNRYNQMISGQEILESTLHRSLIEHLNSEIALGTISDVYSAKFWLGGTFLSVRMRQNPTHYKFSCDTGSTDADQRLAQVCERDIELLQKTRLITNEQRFTSTEYGQAMSRYLVQFDTMKLLLSIPKHAKINQIAAEFKDLRIKPNERACFRELNKSPFIKSPIKENVSTYAHKVSLIVQAQLGGVDLPSDKEFNSMRRRFFSETGIIFERIKRLIRCVIECKAYDSDAIAACNALQLARSIGAGFWENSTLQLRQIPDIGPAAVRKLVQSNVKTIDQIFSMDTAAIERVLGRNPPCGKKILDLLANFPRLALKADIVKKVIEEGVSIKVQVRASLGYTNIAIPIWVKRAPTLTFVAAISNGTLAHIWRGSVRKLEKGLEVAFICELLVPEDIITCSLACEEIVGTIRSVILYPGIVASSFPQRKPSLEFRSSSDSESLEIFKWIGSTPNAHTATKSDSNNHSNYAGSIAGSDYGGDSVFDDFVEIDALDKKRDFREEMGEDIQVGTTEPVRMANGKWQCNHPCSDGQATKKGQPCKHRCCKEGLDKPRKVQKKKPKIVDGGQIWMKSKATARNPSSTAKKSSDGKFKPILKLKEQEILFDEIEFDEIEELDLANKHLVPKSSQKNVDWTSKSTHPEYGNSHGSSTRKSITASCCLDASGRLADLGVLGQDTGGIGENLPSPSGLSRIRVWHDHNELERTGMPPTTPKDRTNIVSTPQSTLQARKSIENSIFDLNAVEARSKLEHLSDNKRTRLSESIQQQAKRPCLEAEGNIEVLGDRKPEPQPVPDWAKDFETDLVAYFFGPDLW